MIGIERIGKFPTDTAPLPVCDRFYPLFFNRHVIQETATVTTLANPASVGDTSIVVSSATGFAIGNSIMLREGSIEECDILQITNIVGTTFTLTRPLCNAYTVAGQVIRSIENMNVNGSLGTPQIFRIKPPSGRVIQINRLLVGMLDNLSMDDTKFGGISALSNGFVVREYVNGIVRTIVQWKNNADIRQDCYDVSYFSSAGNNALGARFTFTNFSHASVLNSATGDEIQFYVQDNLTGLIELEIKAQGVLIR